MSYFVAEKRQKNGKVGADDKGSEDVLSCYCPKLDLTAGSRLEVILKSRFEAAFCCQYDEKRREANGKGREQARSLGESIPAVAQRIPDGDGVLLHDGDVRPAGRCGGYHVDAILYHYRRCLWRAGGHFHHRGGDSGRGSPAGTDDLP